MAKASSKRGPQRTADEEMHDPNSFEELKTQICDILLPRERRALAARRRRRKRN